MIRGPKWNVIRAGMRRADELVGTLGRGPNWGMPRLPLPIFPGGTVEINRNLGVPCAGGNVVYLYGHLPVFQHEENGLPSFRLFTRQLAANGVARSRELVEAFGVPPGTVKRYAALSRREGPSGFYRNQPRQRSETKLTPAVKEQAEALLGAGCSVAEAARQSGVLAPARA